jgi:hypothetical protein
MIKLFVILAMPVLLFACGGSNKKQDKGILKKEKMEAVLWDVLRADAFAFQFVIKDTIKKPEWQYCSKKFLQYTKPTGRSFITAWITTGHIQIFFSPC